MLSFPITSRSTLGLRNSVSSGYRKPYAGIKRPDPYVDHSPPSSAEVKNAWRYAPPPPFCLVYFLSLVVTLARGNSSFYFLIKLLHVTRQVSK